MRTTRVLVVGAALAACKGTGGKAGHGSAAGSAAVATADHAATKVDGPAVTPAITGSITFVVPKDASRWSEIAIPSYATAINLAPGNSVAAP